MTVRQEVVDPLKRYHNEDWHTPKGRAIREVVFGVNDGLITTVGFVSGVVGSIAENTIVLLTGIAQMVAGAISMFFGAYISTKSQRQFFQSEIDREKWEMEHMPEQEKEEIRDIYTGLGFLPHEVEMIIKRVTSNKELWLRFMMREELGMIEEKFDDPVKNGTIMGVSFVAGSIVPLLPYVFMSNVMQALQVSIVCSLLALFGIGAGRVVVTKGRWWVSGLEIMIIGTLTAGIGYVVGLGVARLV